MKLTKTNLFRVLAVMTAGKLLLPIIFINIPLPFRSLGFYYFLWIISVIVFEPKVFLSKYLKYLYSFAAVYLLLILLFRQHYLVHYGEVKFSWVINELIPFFFPMLIFHHFIYKKDFKGLSIVVYFSLMFIIISNFLSIGILVSNPYAARELVGQSGEISYALRGSGLVDYDYINGLVFLIPVFVFLTKYAINKFNFIKLTKWQAITLLTTAYLLIINSNFTIAVMLSSLFMIAAYFHKYSNLKLYLLIALLLFALLPVEVYVKLLYSIGDLFDSPLLQRRFHILAIVIDNRSFVELYGDTSARSRTVRMQEVLSSIFETGFIGGGVWRGHNFWLDRLSVFGLWIFIPLAFSVYHFVKSNMQYFNKDFRQIYLLSVWAYIIFGIVNNMGFPTMNFMFFVLVPGAFFSFKLSSEKTKNLIENQGNKSENTINT